MKKFLLFLLIFLPIYLIINLYYLDKHYFISPIKYKCDIVIRNDNRGDGIFGADRSGSRFHQGIDLLAEVETPVFASRQGIVITAEKNHGMGNFVKIKHSQDIVTLYGHLSKIYVSKNQFVRQGEIIGCVGKTGNANYPDILPHLHFEVRKNGAYQDPLEYLE
jgi:murein DD-endopeptidase MepM/ murein hydrolase activator NlpD